MIALRSRKPLLCRELVELVTDYLEGTLSRRDRARFDEHIAGCPHCTEYLAQFRETLRLTGTLRGNAGNANASVNSPTFAPRLTRASASCAGKGGTFALSHTIPSGSSQRAKKRPCTPMNARNSSVGSISTRARLRSRSHDTIAPGTSATAGAHPNPHVSVLR